MKKDYLWDKSGSDPDIEGFEDLLAVYRHTETDPPLFAAPVAVHTAEPARWWRSGFSFAFPAAAFATLVITVGVFLYSQRDGGEKAKVDIVAVARQIDGHTELPVTGTDNIAPAPEKVADVPPAPMRQPANLARVSLRSKRRLYLPANESAADKRYDDLTGDEKYAYGQLMLALSITGSKLKVVQDTINRIEDPKLKNIDKNR